MTDYKHRSSASCCPQLPPPQPRSPDPNPPGRGGSAESALAESKGHIVVRLAPASLSSERPSNEGLTCKEKGREGGVKCKNLVLPQTRGRAWGAQSCPRTGLWTSGRAQCCSESHPRLFLPLGISGLESRRVALWFVFLPWG